MNLFPSCSNILAAFGIQSNAYDFAYTDEKYFTGRTWYEHMGMHVAGGAAGVASGHYFTDDLGGRNRFSAIGVGAVINSAEWSVTSLIKQRSYARYNGYAQNGFYSGRSQVAKGLIMGSKWLDQSFGILFGK